MSFTLTKLYNVIKCYYKEYCIGKLPLFEWRRLHGFTLIEILVTLSVAILLVVGAVPIFGDLYQRYHLSAEARSLYFALQYARSEAVKNNSNVYVSFATGDNWCYGINTGSACNCATPSACGFGATATQKTQDLSLSLTGISGTSIYFDGTRGAVSQDGVVTFTVYGQSNNVGVKISSLGNMVLCSSTISGYPACS